MSRRRAALVLGLAVLPVLSVLAGCGGSRVPLTSRPTDLGSARELAQAVADAGSCGSFEDLGQGTGYWSFTCQDGPRSFSITAVSGAAERLARLAVVARSSAPVKAGDWYLVQEDLDFGQSKAGPPRPTPVSDLDGFPGHVVG